MNKSELREFSAFLLAIAEVYNRKLTDSAVMIYFDALRDLEFPAIRGAVKLHCQNPEEGRFFPLVAHIRGRICKPEKTALIAWSQVEHVMMRQGAYATVQFTDGNINAVIKDMGGWQWICSQNIDEPWTQREFERRDEAYKAQRIEVHEPLLGIHEVHNRKKGFLEWIPETELIGEGDEVTMLLPKFEKQIGPGEEIVNVLAGKMKM
jgi:hypothetical protein